MSILKFNPIYQERVWGGRRLEEKFARTLPAGKTIGESWELVDRPEAQSIVSHGPLAGKTLRELTQFEGGKIFGPAHALGSPFPILVKWLDCSERLSLQVHPPADLALLLKGEPKTENWYVVESAQDAGLLVGLKNGVLVCDLQENFSLQKIHE